MFDITYLLTDGEKVLAALGAMVMFALGALMGRLR